MKEALKSLSLILIAIFISLFFIWFYLRNRALSEPVPPPLPTPFTQNQKAKTPFLIAYQGGGNERPPNTLPAFDHAAELNPDLILWADIRPTADGVLVAFNSENLASTTDGSGWISFTNFADLDKLDAAAKWRDSENHESFKGQGVKIPTLETLLTRYPTRRFVLNFRDYKPGLDQKIIEIIEKANASERALIQSEQNGLLKDLHEQRPNWLYGTSQAQITQLTMLLPFGLEAMAPFKGDIFVSELKSQRRNLVSDSTIAEVHRRQKLIFTGPVTYTEALELKARGVDGFISSQPTELLQILNNEEK
jgi:glycerophosphoryl diester phosphodiesterase